MTEVQDFGFEAAKGHIDGHSIGAIFGRNPDIDAGPEDIWAGSGIYPGQPAHSDSAETIEIFSSSAADDAAGTGARTVEVVGLDANWLEQSETFTMDGTNAVASTTTWRRAWIARVLTAGSGGANAGTITVRHTSPTANIFVQLPIGQNHSTIAAYTVPDGCTAFIVRVKNQIGRANGSAGSCDYALKVRPEGGVFQDVRYETITTAFSDSYTFVGGLRVNSRSDIKTTAESVSDANTAFSAVFEYILVDNAFLP